MNISTMQKPSAWIPIVMSFTALATLLVHVVLFGVRREADEGAAAHIWQILMVAQLPIIAFFAIKWLPQTPQPSLLVLAFQAAALLLALAPVFLLQL